MNKIFSYLRKPKLIQRLWKKVLSLFYIEQWSLLIAKDNEGTQLSWENFILLAPPKDRFWADPFPWRVNGETFIFYEELPYRTKKGYISCIKLGGNFEILSNEIVLERSYHLSYPFLFEYNGNLYMLPETKQNKTIEIYRCEQFPNKWEKAGILINNIEAVDTTLLEFNNKWWMFTNVIVPGGNAYDSLYLYFSDSPISTNWTPHPLNPIVKDIHSARPAGRIFADNGKLIRPSQDCSVQYGYAINFNSIVTLTKTDYAETCEQTFKPPLSGPVLATHTFNSLAGLTAIDAIRRRRKR